MNEPVSHRIITAVILSIVFAAFFFIGADAKAFTGEKEYSKQAKISIQDARQIARKVRPGKITSEELEKEKSGSGLRYSFDIRSHGKTYEVGVDAVTGKILENAAEGPHPD